MAPSKADREGYFIPPGTHHYNVCFKAGHRQRDLCEFRHQDIEWVWIVEAKRRATPDEIKSLCKREHR